MNTTLCYIEKDNQYLMLHRTKKSNDMNKEKWIGIGGKFEKGETAIECVIREVKEETGLTIISPEYRGIITFNSNIYGMEIMHLFTAKNFTGNINYNCNEGELCWVDKDKIYQLNLWEGDKIFLDLLNKERRFFKVQLNYVDDTLKSYKVEF